MSGSPQERSYRKPPVSKLPRTGNTFAALADLDNTPESMSPSSAIRSQREVPVTRTRSSRAGTRSSSSSEISLRRPRATRPTFVTGPRAEHDRSPHESSSAFDTRPSAAGSTKAWDISSDSSVDSVLDDILNAQRQAPTFASRKPTRAALSGRPTLGKRGSSAVSSGSDSSSANGSVVSSTKNEVSIDPHGRDITLGTLHTRSLRVPEMAGRTMTRHFHRRRQQRPTRVAGADSEGRLLGPASVASSDSSMDINISPGSITRKDRKVETTLLEEKYRYVKGASYENRLTDQELMAKYGLKRGQQTKVSRRRTRHRNSKDADLDNPFTSTNIGF